MFLTSIRQGASLRRRAGYTRGFATHFPVIIVVIVGAGLAAASRRAQGDSASGADDHRRQPIFGGDARPICQTTTSLTRHRAALRRKVTSLTHTLTHTVIIIYRCLGRVAPVSYTHLTLPTILRV